jgi:hypothetical protein
VVRTILREHARADRKRVARRQLAHARSERRVNGCRERGEGPRPRRPQVLPEHPAEDGAARRERARRRALEVGRVVEPPARPRLRRRRALAQRREHVGRHAVRLEVAQEEAEQVEVRRLQLGDHLLDRRREQVDRDAELQRDAALLGARALQLDARERREEDLVLVRVPATSEGCAQEDAVLLGRCSGGRGM